MRKLLQIVVAAVALSASAQSAGQHDAARDWYLPPTSKAVTQIATLFYTDEKTSKDQELQCGVDLNGRLQCRIGGELVDAEEYFKDTAFSPEMYTAASALQSALLAQYEIQNLGKNLQKALGAERTYTIKQGAQATVTVKIPGIDINAAATSAAPGGNNIQTTGSGIPYPDNKTIAKDNNGKWHLKDWEVAAVSDTLANALADNDKNTGRGWSEYQVLVRSAANGVLEYLKIGSGIGAQVDDSTISSNSQSRLEIKGWESEGAAKSESAYVFPYARGKQYGVTWGEFGEFFSDGAFEFDDGELEGALYLRGWRDEDDGTETSISALLSDSDAEGRDSYYVLARSGTGNDAVLAYLPIGDVIDGSMLVDGKSIVTNETSDGTASVAGAATAAQGFVPYSDGEGGFAWDYATPTVAWDDSTDTLTVTTPRDDGETKTVVFPRISVEKEDGEDSTTYTVTWRDLNGEETEETEISVPKTAAVSPDNVTIVTNDGNVAVYGWKSNKSTKYAVPHAGGDALAWRGFGDFFESATFDWSSDTGKVTPKGYGSGAGNSHYFGTSADGGVGWWELPNVTTNYVQGDEKSITSTTDGDTKKLGLKGWNASYSGDVPLYAANVGGEIVYREIPAPAPPDGVSVASNSQGRVEIKDWKIASGCSEKLSALLSDEQQSTQRDMHQLVTRYGTGDGAVIHYLPIGDTLPKPLVPDGKSVVTNETDDGSASVAGAASATLDMVPFSDGYGGFDWDYMEPYAWFDGESDALAFTPYDPNGGDTEYVKLPHISIEQEDGENATTYKIKWRDLDGDDDTETVISVPSTNAQAKASIAVDGVTIVTNAPSHAGEAALKGFWDAGTKDGMFPIKSGDALAWVSTNAVSVTTNAVDGDNITISSTTDGDTKKLGLKDWNAKYSGDFPLFLVNDGGALGYYQLPGAVTNLSNFAQCDNKSLATNDVGGLEIYGWKSQDKCGTDAANILTGQDNLYHEMVTRIGGKDGTLHYLPFGKFPNPDTSQFNVNSDTKKFTIKGTDGKFLKGTAQGGVEWADIPVDEKSVTLNTAKKITLNGFSVADPDTVAYKDSDGNLAWRWQPALFVDGVSVASNANNQLEVAGFALADPGTVPTRTEGGRIEWLPSGGGAATRLVGTDDNAVVLGSGPTTNTVTFASETNANVTVKIATNDIGGVTVKIGVYWK